MVKAIKIILAVLLFLCLADMPYGYYQLVRIIGMVGFVILANEARQKNNQAEIIIFLGLALLFQPFFKIALGRTIWNIVDVVVGVWLLLSIIRKTKDFSVKNNPEIQSSLDIHHYHAQNHHPCRILAYISAFVPDSFLCMEDSPEGFPYLTFFCCSSDVTCAVCRLRSGLCSLLLFGGKGFPERNRKQKRPAVSGLSDH